MNFTDFHFPDTCITIGDIRKVFIIEGSTDGWNIDSITTLVKDSLGGIQLLTRDLDVNRWVDGDSDYTRRRFELTLA